MTMYRGSKSFGGKMNKEKSLLQKAVLTFLMTGVVAWPSFSPVYATDSVFTGHDGRIETSGKNHDIYAGTKVSDAVGVNKFTNFNVAQNEVANLHFTRWNGGEKDDNFHTLLNFVQNRIEVNGTVNALRNDRIGGNLYFISSSGMIVGQSGAINAGALTVTVPQSAYLTGIMTGSLEGASNAFLKDTIANSVPLNSSGSIVVNGKIRTGLGAKFNAANIIVGKEVEFDGDKAKVKDGGANYDARIYTGVDFGRIVDIPANYSGFDTDFENGQHRLQIRKDEEGYYVLDAVQDMKGDGTVTLQANLGVERSSGETVTGFANNTVAVKLVVGHNAKITSVGDVNLIAHAEAKGNGENPQPVACVEANIDMQGLVTASGSVNITADADVVNSLNLSDPDSGTVQNTVAVNNTITLENANIFAVGTLTVKTDTAFNMLYSSNNDLRELINNVTINDKTEIKDSELRSHGDLLVGSYGNHQLSIAKFGMSSDTLPDGAVMKVSNTVVKTDNVTVSGTSELRTLDKDAKIYVVATDNTTADVSGFFEQSINPGVAAATTVTDSITRNNIINISGTSRLLSYNDVNLFANKDENNLLGRMTVNESSRTFSIGDNVFPSSGIASNLTQNSQVTVDNGAKVEAVGDVNIYADEGVESVYRNTSSYCWNPDKELMTTSKGSIGNNITDTNYVQVDGQVTAGVLNKIAVYIGKNNDDKIYVVVPDDGTADHISPDVNQVLVVTDVSAKDGKYYLYQSGAEKGHGTEITNFINFGFEEYTDGGHTYTVQEQEEEFFRITGIQRTDFSAQSVELGRQTLSQLEQLDRLLNEYGVDKGSAYDSLKAERDRLYNLAKSMRLLSDDPSSASLSGVNLAINLPNLYGQGGNVDIATSDLKGTDTGKITAKGQASINILNNSSMLLQVNDVVIDHSGGRVYYNNEALLEDTYTTRIGEINKTAGTAFNGQMVTQEGTEPGINITGTWADVVHFNEYTFENDQHVNVTAPACDMKVPSHIYVVGEVVNKAGVVNIGTEEGDIVVSGERATVNGTTVTIHSNSGRIFENDANGLINIGGAPEILNEDSSDASYRKYFDEFVAAYNSEAGRNVYLNLNNIPGVVRKDGDKPLSGRITGADIVLSAADINVNGIIQSGFGEYRLNLTAADEARIQAIRNSIGSGEVKLADKDVLNNPRYLIREGGAVWDSASQSYVYEIGAYYNPSTDTVVTSRVDANGGHIFLNGRISSTGDGMIKCLDGVYNITVKNAFDHNLALNDLVVNDVQGSITIVDSGLGKAVEITRSGGVKPLQYGGTTGKDTSQITANGSGYTYQPKGGLTYEWVNGTKQDTEVYYYEDRRETWWGWSDYKPYSTSPGEAVTLDREKPEQTFGERPRLDGSFIVDEGISLGNELEMTRYLTKVEADDVWTQDGDPTTYTTGLYGCHKWMRFHWKKNKGLYYTNQAKVRADNKIDISFLGTAAENGKVDIINAAATDKNILIYGNIGNTKLYEIKDPADETIITDRIEKGSVNIKSNGSIDYIGGNIYAKDVDLSAKGNINNVQIKAGDIVNLNAWSTLADGKVNVYVNRNGLANGAVQVGAFGGADNKNASVALASLTSQGDILRANTAKYNNGIAIVQGDRIDLISTEGQIGAADNFLFVNGGQIPNTNNSMSASVNAEAKNNIYLHQTQGNLRVGRIIVNDLNTGDNGHGNLYIEVPEGSIQDAQSFVEYLNPKDTKQDLISQWAALGLVDDGSEQAKAMIAMKNEQAEYTPWSVDQLLYAFQSSIFEDGATSSPKDPNLYGYNIDLKVRDNVGIFDEDVKVISTVGLYDKDASGKFIHMDDIRAISWAGPTTAVYDSAAQTITLKEQIAIGLQEHSDVSNPGKLTVTGYATNDGYLTGDVNLETRRFQDLAKSNTLDLTVDAVKANGDVRITGLANLISSAETDKAVIITNGNLFLNVGDSEITDQGFSIGASGKFFAVQAAGNTQLSATGDIYLQSIGDLNVLDIVAGRKDYADIGGKINISTLQLDGNASTGNIYGVYVDGQDVEGNIRSANAKGITLKAAGSIGSWEDSSKTVYLKNVADDADADATVSLTAGQEIAVEGVSANDSDPGKLVIAKLESTQNTTTVNKARVNVDGDLVVTGNAMADTLVLSGENVTNNGTGGIRAVNLNVKANTDITLRLNDSTKDNIKVDNAHLSASGSINFVNAGSYSTDVTDFNVWVNEDNTTASNCAVNIESAQNLVNKGAFGGSVALKSNGAIVNDGTITTMNGDIVLNASGYVEYRRLTDQNNDGKINMTDYNLLPDDGEGGKVFETIKAGIYNHTNSDYIANGGNIEITSVYTVDASGSMTATKNAGQTAGGNISVTASDATCGDIYRYANDSMCADARAEGTITYNAKNKEYLIADMISEDDIILTFDEAKTISEEIVSLKGDVTIQTKENGDLVVNANIISGGAVNLISAGNLIIGETAAIDAKGGIDIQVDKGCISVLNNEEMEQLHIGQLDVSSGEVKADMPIIVDNLNVDEKVEFYSQGTKTSVYGEMQGYDKDAQVIYFQNGHQGMQLGILSGLVQKSGGILLKNVRGYSVYGHSYSVESLMQNLLSIDVDNVFNATFNNNVQSFSRFDNVAIPDVVVNTAEDLDKGEFEF